LIEDGVLSGKAKKSPFEATIGSVEELGYLLISKLFDLSDEITLA
jgi:hypothetical protein